MSYILIPVLIALMVMVVLSMVRGIAAFLKSTRTDLESPGNSGPSEMQLRQNKLMFARIMYQAAAIVVVALVLFASK